MHGNKGCVMGLVRGNERRNGDLSSSPSQSELVIVVWILFYLLFYSLHGAGLRARAVGSVWE